MRKTQKNLNKYRKLQRIINYNIISFIIKYELIFAYIAKCKMKVHFYANNFN
jgi:hypothetical protein